MTDDLDPHTTAVAETATGEPADRPWPGPLGNPNLTGAQRQRLAEDRVLAVEAQLGSDDHSIEAQQVRATAASIRDHHEMAQRRTVQAFQDRTAAREAALTKFRAYAGGDLSQLTDEELTRAREITLGAVEYGQLSAKIDRRADVSRSQCDPTGASGPPAPTDSGVRMLVPRTIVGTAQREWQRLGDVPAAARVALVADVVWQREYPASYRSAYTTAASRIAAAATDAAAANPKAWITLHQLAAAAGDAISRLARGQPLAPPADQRTVAAAQSAAAAAGQQPSWQRVAENAWAGSRTAGTLAGTLTAATDILIGWRARSGEALAEAVSINGQPARTWIADLLAAVNRDTAAPAAAGGTPRTAAQLARQDQAPGVSAMTVGAVSSRARQSAPAAPGAMTTRRAR